MWHKPCRTFHPWCLCIKTRCLFNMVSQLVVIEMPRTMASSLVHYNDIIMNAMASQVTSLTVVYSTIYSSTDERKHQSSVSLAFVWGIHRWPVNSPQKRQVTRKLFPFDDVIIVFSLTGPSHEVWFSGDRLECLALTNRIASPSYQFHPN